MVVDLMLLRAKRLVSLLQEGARVVDGARGLVLLLVVMRLV